MKNLTLENITKACQGTYYGDESLFRQPEGEARLSFRRH